MAVKSSGSLSLTTDIIGEFGGDVPHSLSEYYGGGTYVPAGANPGVATSGTINMGSFYDTVAATVLTITSSTNNYDIGAAAIAAGGDKNTPVILTINSGVTVGSTSSSTPAMYTGTGWGSGVTINITNNGSIVGASGSNTSAVGGSGGNGGRGSSYCCPNYAGAGGSGGTGSGSADSANNGGNAFEHSQTGDNNLSVIFDTAGTRTGGSAGTKTIYGGGGGGGGGGHGLVSNCYSFCYGTGGGGGGGQGSPGGSGGDDGFHGGGCGSYGQDGSAGTANSAGSGGNGGGHGAARGGNGGTSGSAGQSGTNGTHSNGASGGAGGSNGSASGTAGSALSGNTGQIS